MKINTLASETANEAVETQQDSYLYCEKKSVFFLLMMCSGMMGAYTFTLRGGVFCNAQTANIVIMSIAIGQGRWLDGLYCLIPIAAYTLGSFVSEALPTPIKHLGLFRWDTVLVAFEAVTLLVIGFVPLSFPDKIIQIVINFIAAMQFNTFRQAEGIPMATTFCTNHVRQLGVGIAKGLRKHDISAMQRAGIHLLMLTGFFGGGALLSLAAEYMQERAIWLALIPLGIILCTLVYADLVSEKNFLKRKPHGH